VDAVVFQPMQATRVDRQPVDCLSRNLSARHFFHDRSIDELEFELILTPILFGFFSIRNFGATFGATF